MNVLASCVNLVARRRYRAVQADRAASDRVPNLLANFSAALDDDLNISAAWGAVFDWVRETNKRIAESSLNADRCRGKSWRHGTRLIPFSASARNRKRKFQRKFLPWLRSSDKPRRKAKDFKQADAIRDELKAKGWIIEDTPKGPKLKKI